MKRIDFGWRAAVVRKFVWTVMAGLVLAAAPFSFAKSPAELTIDRAVTALVSQMSDGVAVSLPEFRRIVFADVLGNGQKDAVAFFAIEGFGGGNNHAEYLALFAAVPADAAAAKPVRPFRLVTVMQIGGRGWRSLDWATAVLKPGVITVSGKKYGKQDAMCCPSEPVAVTFQWINANLLMQEQKVSTVSAVERPGRSTTP